MNIIPRFHSTEADTPFNSVDRDPSDGGITVEEAAQHPNPMDVQSAITQAYQNGKMSRGQVTEFVEALENRFPEAASRLLHGGVPEWAHEIRCIVGPRDGFTHEDLGCE
ncbi:MAG: hypothetical protein AAFX94_05685, partial [Myxococcota bacterium]